MTTNSIILNLDYPQNLIVLCRNRKTEEDLAPEKLEEIIEKELTPMQRYIVFSRFKCKFSLTKIAEQTEFSKERIRQLQVKVIHIIRKCHEEGSAKTQFSIKISPDFYDVPISELKLSTRIKNNLSRAGKTTIGDLENTSEYDFLRMRNFGDMSYKALKQSLREFQARCENERH